MEDVIRMKIVLRQTPRTIDRLFGSGGARGKVEFCGYNEEGQLLYTIIIAMAIALLDMN